MKDNITGFFTAKVLLVILLTLSVILNLMLARKIEQLNRAVSAAESFQSLTVGTIVPSLEAKELNGNDIAINFPDSQKSTLIYIFTPQCMWCTRNLDNIRVLSTRIADRYRVIGISLTSENLPEYLAKNQLGFPVYTEPSTGTKTNYKLGVTPKTIIVSPEGKVLKTWNGAYSGDLKLEIEDFFHIALPNTVNVLASKD